MSSTSDLSSTSSTATSTLVVDNDGGAMALERNGSRVRTVDVLKVLFIVAGFALGCLLLVVLAPLLLSIVIAIFLAVAADPVVRFFQRRGLARTPAVLVFTGLLVVVLLALVAVFVPPLIDQGTQLATDTPGYVQDLRDTKLVRDADKKYDIIDKASAQVEKLPAKVGSQLGTVVATIFAGVFGALTVIFLMVLLLLGGGELTGGLVQVFPAIASRRWWKLIIDSYRSVSGYVAGTLLIAVIAGVTVLVACFALGLPSPLPLALWMGLLDVVPLVGATIGALPAVTVAFLAGGVTDGIIMCVALLVYQQAENLVIQPAILGKVVSLSPVIVFVAILAGSQLLGITGALLAIPLAGIAQIFLREALADRAEADLEVPPIAPDDVPDRPDPTPDDHAD
ncbi:MAG: family transporter [Thermoleophilia bacterium]|nr:family transporter [Thermoleophilia bacterium]